MSERYKIVRMFYSEDKRRRTIVRGLTLKEARKHCQDPETSSKTCTKPYPKSITSQHGPWFEGYEHE